jgi:hypothetical protein
MGHTVAFHDELKDDDARWGALALAGYNADDPDEPAREMRHCSCGSTLERPAADQLHAREWWGGYLAGRAGTPSIIERPNGAWRWGWAAGARAVALESEISAMFRRAA